MSKHKEEDSTQTTLYLPVWVLEGIRELGRRQGNRTNASIIREATIEYLAKHGIDNVEEKA